MRSFIQRKAIFSFGGLVVLGGLLLILSSPHPARAGGKVLILGPTVISPASSSPEYQNAVALGEAVEVVDAAGWAAKSTLDFAAYDEIILGDPDCPSEPSSLSAAIANKNVWGPAVRGRIVIIGGDPVCHYSRVGAQRFVKDGIAFALGRPGSTGAYITLSNDYYNAPPNTPLTLMDGISPGGFAIEGFNVDGAQIVNPNPAFADLSDSNLSGWGNTVHEIFNRFPSNFSVFACGFEIETTPGRVVAPRQIAGGRKTPSQGCFPFILLRDALPALSADVPEADTLLLTSGGIGGLATWLGWQWRKRRAKK